MGIYQDIQKDVKYAFDNDLSDATRYVNIITITDSYDKVTMKSTQTETSISVRAVVMSDFESERVDEPTRWNNYKILVLDSERNGVTFEPDSIIEDGLDRFKIVSRDQDPAKATWTVYARRLG